VGLFLIQNFPCHSLQPWKRTAKVSFFKCIHFIRTQSPSMCDTRWLRSAHSSCWIICSNDRGIKPLQVLTSYFPMFESIINLSVETFKNSQNISSTLINT
jgi:hypothetical protein